MYVLFVVDNETKRIHMLQRRVMNKWHSKYYIYMYYDSLLKRVKSERKKKQCHSSFQLIVAGCCGAGGKPPSPQIKNRIRNSNASLLLPLHSIITSSTQQQVIQNSIHSFRLNLACIISSQNYRQCSRRIWPSHHHPEIIPPS